MDEAYRTPATAAPNLADRAADSVDKMLDATKRAADAALDSVSGKVHDLRDRASPVVDRIASPFDAVTVYTRQSPLKALLASAAAGAALMAVFALLRRSPR